jgi:uncharacterized protein
MGSREIGRVVGLWRYPVKSMAPERLEAVEVGWHGLVGDRRWAFIRGDVPRSGFPWLTIREQVSTLQHVPRLVDPERPDKSRVVVRTPAGEELDVTDPALAASLGEGARVIKQDRGVFDEMPLSLITTQAIAGLSPELHPQRFRPNLLVEAAEPGRGPVPEDDWVGHELRIGDVVMRVDQRDKRCVVVNVDPATGQRDPAVLKEIARTRETCLGVYGTIVRRGRVARGDAVVVDR